MNNIIDFLGNPGIGGIEEHPTIPDEFIRYGIYKCPCGKGEVYIEAIASENESDEYNVLGLSVKDIIEIKVDCIDCSKNYKY